jgi:hypothetical protein
MKIMKKIHPIGSHQKLHCLGLSLVEAIFKAGCTGAPPTEQMAVSKVAISSASNARLLSTLGFNAILMRAQHALR